MLINARYINNKSCILYDLIVVNSLSLLFITETWIAETDSASIAAFLPGTHDFIMSLERRGEVVELGWQPAGHYSQSR